MNQSDSEESIENWLNNFSSKNLKRHLMLIFYQALCVVRQHRCLFDNGIYWRKTLKNAKKEQADIVLPVSPKVALGNKRPMPNVYDVVPQVSDVVPQVRRINKTY